MPHKKTQICKDEVLLRNIPGLNRIELSRWRTAVANELCFRPLIRNKDASTGAVDDLLLQSTAAQDAEGSQLSRSELVVVAFQDFKAHFRNKVAEMQENAQ